MTGDPQRHSYNQKIKKRASLSVLAQKELKWSKDHEKSKL
jgi:hypothetical protein